MRTVGRSCQCEENRRRTACFRCSRRARATLFSCTFSTPENVSEKGEVNSKVVWAGLETCGTRAARFLPEHLKFPASAFVLYQSYYTTSRENETPFSRFFNRKSIEVSFWCFVKFHFLISSRRYTQKITIKIIAFRPASDISHFMGPAIQSRFPIAELWRN